MHKETSSSRIRPVSGERPNTYLPYLQLLGAAALFSTGGAAIKATSLSGWQVAGMRSGIAALALFLVTPAARRRITWRAALVGISYAATMILFVSANKLTTAANTIFLQSTAPLYILLLGPWLLREPVKRRDLFFMAIVAAGLALFFVSLEASTITAPDPLRGNLLATLSGLSWALTIMGLRWTGQGETDSAAAIILGNSFAFVFCLPFLFPFQGVSWVDGAVLAYLGVFQIALAYLWMTKALRHLRALEASVLLLIEPALNPIWAWLLHRERPGLWALTGGALILGATVAKTWSEARKAPSSLNR